MSIEKYKIKLEAAIYESCDKFYIGGKVVEEVLKEYHAEQLNLPPVIKSVCDDYFPSFDKPNICLHCGFYKHEHS